ncbi:hypothetical protein [Haloechinothrix salitolerans]|uniref:Uncharacterized protein n=1 Tax=Haloechinothrix salitolerans TaxID=926830 RepID=A0ABW2C133_9PSEU
MNWFFLLVIALACAPVLGCLWWVLNSKISDRRRTRIAERMSQTYYHEAVKVPGREPERRSRRSPGGEPTGERTAARDTGERASVRQTGERQAIRGSRGRAAAASGEHAAGWRPDDASDPGPWPVAEPDAVDAEPVCCMPRQVAHHDGPCDCWEDTTVFELRDGMPAVPVVPRAPQRASEWRPPQRPPSPQDGRSSARPQRPPAQRPPAQRPPAQRPPAQRPPAQRREWYPDERREARPAQRAEQRVPDRTAARQQPPAQRPAEARNRHAADVPSYGKHHLS